MRLDSLVVARKYIKSFFHHHGFYTSEIVEKGPGMIKL